MNYMQDLTNKIISFLYGNYSINYAVLLGDSYYVI